MIKLMIMPLAISVVFTAFLTAPLFGQTVVDSITYPASFRPWSLAIYETGDKLFVRDRDEKLLVYDGTSLSLLADLPVAYRPGYSGTIIHEQGGKLYATAWYPLADSITVVNTVTNELIGYIQVKSPSGYFAKDEDLGRVYNIGGFPDKYLYVIDVFTDSIIESIPLSGGAIINGIDVNPVTHEVFIGYMTVNSGEKLDVVDGLKLTCITMDSPNGHGMVVNWLENKVYRELGSLDGFWVYDRDIDSVTNYVTGNDATVEVFNPTTNRVHTSSEVNGESTIIECASDSSFDIPLFSGAVCVGIHYTSNHVYYVGYDSIAVLEGSTLEWLAKIPNIWVEKPNVFDIAINQTTGRVFVSYSDGLGASNSIIVIEDIAEGTKGENEVLAVPKDYFLSQNFPNPYNPATTIEFSLPKTEQVRIEVFNTLGQKVATLLDKQMPVGFHEVKFNAQDLPGGIYVYRIVAGDFIAKRKCLLLK